MHILYICIYVGNIHGFDFAARQGCAFDPPEVYETCKELEEAGYAMQKAPDGGSMKGLDMTFSYFSLSCYLMTLHSNMDVDMMLICSNRLRLGLGLAFARDPDGYWVEIIKRGGYDEAATPYFFEK